MEDFISSCYNKKSEVFYGLGTFKHQRYSIRLPGTAE